MAAAVVFLGLHDIVQYNLRVTCTVDRFGETWVLQDKSHLAIVVSMTPGGGESHLGDCIVALGTTCSGFSVSI